jgi:hypothetical protein
MDPLSGSEANISGDSDPKTRLPPDMVIFCVCVRVISFPLTELATDPAGRADPLAVDSSSDEKGVTRGNGAGDAKGVSSEVTVRNHFFFTAVIKASCDKSTWAMPPSKAI